MTKSNFLASRTDLYKCLALMALAQQGKHIEEKLLENYVNRGEAKGKARRTVPNAFVRRVTGADVGRSERVGRSIHSFAEGRPTEIDAVLSLRRSLCVGHDSSGFSSRNER